MKSEPIDIICPTCKSLAKFEEPFKFKSARELKGGIGDDLPSHSWGGWIVVERFPSQIKWKAPTSSQQYLRCGGGDGSEGYPLLTNGIIQCSACHTNLKHKLNWPLDAYWQWEIRGQTLWAWDKNQALEILTYIKSELRPSRHSYSLRYIPEHFLSAKVRALIVQRLEQSLST